MTAHEEYLFHKQGESVTFLATPSKSNRACELRPLGITSDARKQLSRKHQGKDHSSWKEDTTCNLQGDSLNGDSMELLCSNMKAHGSMG